VLLAKNQSLPILNILGLTRPARAGLELTTYRVLSESTTTRLRQPVIVARRLFQYSLENGDVQTIYDIVFEDFYAGKVAEQLKTNCIKNVRVNMHLSKIKPLYAHWITETLDDLAKNLTQLSTHGLCANYGLNRLMPHCLDSYTRKVIMLFM
jgi:hypothetical protein